MIDTSYWKQSDLAWTNTRDERWPIFSQWLTDQFSQSSDRNLLESLKKSKAFYDTGLIDPPSSYSALNNVPYYAMLALHPDISERNVREILNLDNFKGFSLKGGFNKYYSLKQTYIYLLDKEVLPGHFMLTLIRGFYGSNMEEAARILEFNPRDEYCDVAYNLGLALFGYFFNSPHEYFTYETAHHMLPFYWESLENLTEEEAKKCDFCFKKHIKVKTKFYDSGEVSDPTRRKFMEELLAGIKARWSKMNPTVQERLAPLMN